MNCFFSIFSLRRLQRFIEERVLRSVQRLRQFKDAKGEEGVIKWVMLLLLLQLLSCLLESYKCFNAFPDAQGISERGIIDWPFKCGCRIRLWSLSSLSRRQRIGLQRLLYHGGSRYVGWDSQNNMLYLHFRLKYPRKANIYCFPYFRLCPQDSVGKQSIFDQLVTSIKLELNL